MYHIKQPNFTFFDFCSGIGSGRIALEKNKMHCVGYSEIDLSADKTYRFFGEKEQSFGNLMTIDHRLLPDFNLLMAGFPCQVFSIVGNRTGFQHHSGNIISGIYEILKFKKPDMFC